VRLIRGGFEGRVGSGHIMGNTLAGFIGLLPGSEVSEADERFLAEVNWSGAQDLNG
jgi:hypothetical protein